MKFELTIKGHTNEDDDDPEYVRMVMQDLLANNGSEIVVFDTETIEIKNEV